VQALRTTHHYELIDDTLILSGADSSGETSAQLTFMIDNETKKPPDWW
jgi:hypothetical protein